MFILYNINLKFILFMCIFLTGRSLFDTFDTHSTLQRQVLHRSMTYFITIHYKNVFLNS